MTIKFKKLKPSGSSFAGKLSAARKNAAVPTAILIFLACLMGPWWAGALPAFGAGFLIGAPSRRKRAREAYLLGFFAGGFAWFVAAAYHDLLTGGRLSRRIGGVFGVGSGEASLSSPLRFFLFYLAAPFAAYCATFVLGGLIAALGAASGQRLRAIFS